MTEIVGLDAVVLIVKDLSAQRHFYGEVLGLPLKGDYGDALFFGCGNQTLALFALSHHPEGTKRLEGASKGISHLEFRVHEQDYAAIRQRLTDLGYEAYRENFQDADGNLFHFNTERDG